MNYFSFDKFEKYCSACSTVISLKKFRVMNPEREPDMSSYYCSQCRECENKRAKLNQKARFNNDIPAKIMQLELQIERFQKRIQLLKEKI